MQSATSDPNQRLRRLKGEKPTDDELRAIQRYKGPVYREMNAMLRGRAKLEVDDQGNLRVDGKTTNRSLSEFQEDFDQLANFVRKAPRYDGDTVYRGITLPPEELDILEARLEDGGDWEDGAFVSTATADSPSKWVEESHMFSERGMVIEISLPNADAADDVEHGGIDMDRGETKTLIGLNHENEVLFPPGQRFRVKEIVKNDKDKVRQRLGLQNPKAKFTADTYIRLEALPYQESDLQRFQQRVRDLSVGEAQGFKPPEQPGRAAVGGDRR